MRCIVYREVWCIYLFYILLWILSESTIAFRGDTYIEYNIVTHLILFADKNEIKNSG